MPAVPATVLDEDPDLAERVAPARLPAARRASVAAVEVADAPRWRPTDVPDGGYGLLVLDGLLVRRVHVLGKVAAELLATGDVLRPGDEQEATIESETTWQVLARARLAHLDERWMASMAPYPEVGAALVRRTLDRFERLLAMASIGAQRRLDVRLWMLLWQLADRHGRVHPDGVHLDVPLTHDVLSHLVGARRPSVSTALAGLAAEGRLRRDGRVWILIGGPPPP